MSHHKAGKLVCLLALFAGLGWSQAVVAATTERDRLEKMLREAKRKLVIVDQFIRELEVKTISAKAEVDRTAAVFNKSGLEKDRQAMLDAIAQYQVFVQALVGAKADRVQVLALIEHLKAKLRALGPPPTIGPVPVRGQPNLAHNLNAERRIPSAAALR